MSSVTGLRPVLMYYALSGLKNSNNSPPGIYDYSFIFFHLTDGPEGDKYVCDGHSSSTINSSNITLKGRN
jgi:hypothetical protein